ncbi:MarR family winged helix-turn-helix transcriptional regulator [Paracoccus aeridis]|uniref:MarR family winged helix-turn-helix transcriptional regulator n=1 Tax=Paracoccus aeridis TaxID=1966466 RepID=UPI0010AB35E2|nr:MarR family transcriptional regulator [Paracoccus aeridis]
MTDSTPLVLTLFRLLKELRRNYDDEVRELGLSFSRARVLSVLMRHDGATQAELAAALDMAAPSLKRQLDLLEAEKLIERRGLGGDARKRALFLTPRAKAFPLNRYMDRIRDQLLEGISPEEQAQLHSVLERLADNAARMNDK